MKNKILNKFLKFTLVVNIFTSTFLLLNNQANATTYNANQTLSTNTTGTTDAITGATLTVNSGVNYTATSLDISSVTVGGPPPVTTGGILSNSGQTTISGALTVAGLNSTIDNLSGANITAQSLSITTGGYVYNRTGATLVISSNTSIDAASLFNNYGTLTTGGAFTVTGVGTMNNIGTWTANGSISGKITNIGTLNANNGITGSITNTGTVNAQNGTITVADLNGIWNIGNTTSATTTAIAGATTFSGTISNLSKSTLNIASNLTVSGAFSNTGITSITGTTTLTGIGSINNLSNMNFTGNVSIGTGASLINSGGATMTANSDLSLATGGTFSNAGQLNLNGTLNNDGSGAFSNTGTITFLGSTISGLNNYQGNWVFNQTPSTIITGDINNNITWSDNITNNNSNIKINSNLILGGALNLTNNSTINFLGGTSSAHNIITTNNMGLTGKWSFGYTSTALYTDIIGDATIGLNSVNTANSTLSISGNLTATGFKNLGIMTTNGQFSGSNFSNTGTATFAGGIAGANTDIKNTATTSIININGTNPNSFQVGGSTMMGTWNFNNGSTTDILNTGTTALNISGDLNLTNANLTLGSTTLSGNINMSDSTSVLNLNGDFTTSVSGSVSSKGTINFMGNTDPANPYTLGVSNFYGIWNIGSSSQNTYSKISSGITIKTADTNGSTGIFTNNSGSNLDINGGITNNGKFTNDGTLSLNGNIDNSGISFTNTGTIKFGGATSTITGISALDGTWIFKNDVNGLNLANTLVNGTLENGGIINFTNLTVGTSAQISNIVYNDGLGNTTAGTINISGGTNLNTFTGGTWNLGVTGNASQISQNGSNNNLTIDGNTTVNIIGNITAGTSLTNINNNGRMNIAAGGNLIYINAGAKTNTFTNTTDGTNGSSILEIGAGASIQNLNILNNTGGIVLSNNITAGTGSADDFKNVGTISITNNGTMLYGFDNSVLNSTTVEADTRVNGFIQLVSGIGTSLTKDSNTATRIVHFDNNQKTSIDSGYLLVNGSGQVDSGSTLTVGDSYFAGNDTYSQDNARYHKDSFTYFDNLSVLSGGHFTINNDGLVYVDNSLTINSDIVLNGALVLNNNILDLSGGTIKGTGTLYTTNTSGFIIKNSDEMSLNVKIGQFDNLNPNNSNKGVLNYIQEAGETSAGQDRSPDAFYNKSQITVDSITNIVMESERTANPTNFNSTLLDPAYKNPTYVDNAQEDRSFINKGDLRVVGAGSQLNIFNVKNVCKGWSTSTGECDSWGPANTLINWAGDATTDINGNTTYANISTATDTNFYLTSDLVGDNANFSILDNATTNVYGGRTIIGLGTATIQGTLNIYQSQGLDFGTASNYTNNTNKTGWLLNGVDVTKADGSFPDISTAPNGATLINTVVENNKAPVINVGGMGQVVIPGTEASVSTQGQLNAATISTMSHISYGSIGLNANGAVSHLDALNFSGCSTSSCILNVINTALVAQASPLTAIVDPATNQIKFIGPVQEGYFIAVTPYFNYTNPLTGNLEYRDPGPDGIIGTADDMVGATLIESTDPTTTGDPTDPKYGILGAETTSGDQNTIGIGDVTNEVEVPGRIYTDGNLESYATINMDYNSILDIGHLSNYNDATAKDLFQSLRSGATTFVGNKVDAKFANELWTDTNYIINNGTSTITGTTEKGGIRITSGGIFVSGNMYNHIGDLSSHLYIGNGTSTDAFGDSFLYVGGNFEQDVADSVLKVSSDGRVYIGGKADFNGGSFIVDAGGIVYLNGDLTFKDATQTFTNNGEINFIGKYDITKGFPSITADDRNLDGTQRRTDITGIPDFSGTGVYNFISKDPSTITTKGLFNINLNNTNGTNNGNLNFQSADVNWGISGLSSIKSLTNNGNLNITGYSVIRYNFNPDATGILTTTGKIKLTDSDTSNLTLEKNSKIIVGEERAAIAGDTTVTPNILPSPEYSIGTIDFGTGNADIRGTIASKGRNGTSTWGGDTIDASKNQIVINSGKVVIDNSLTSKSNLTIKNGGQLYIGYDWTDNQTGNDTTVDVNGMIDYGKNTLSVMFAQNTSINSGLININGDLSTTLTTVLSVGDRTGSADSSLFVNGNFKQKSAGATTVINTDGMMEVIGNTDLSYGVLTLNSATSGGRDGLLLGSGLTIGTLGTKNGINAGSIGSNLVLDANSRIVFTGKGAALTTSTNSATDRFQISGINNFAGKWSFENSAAPLATPVFYNIKGNGADISNIGNINVGLAGGTGYTFDISTDTNFINGGIANSGVAENGTFLLNKNSTFTVNGNLTNTAGTFTNAGSVIVANDFNNSYKDASTLGSFTNTGTLDISGNFNNQTVLTGTTYEGQGQFNNANGKVIMHGGLIQGNETSISGIQSMDGEWIINNGWVKYDSNSQANNYVSGGNFAGGDNKLDLTSTGKLTINSGASFDLIGGLDLTAGGTLNMAGGNLYVGGQVLNSKTFNLDILSNPAVIATNGSSKIEFSANQAVDVTTSNSNIQGTLIFNNDNLINDIGHNNTLTNTTGADINLTAGGLIITSNDNLVVQGGNTGNFTTAAGVKISNSGTLDITNSITTNGQVDNVGTINVGKDMTSNADLNMGPSAKVNVNNGTFTQSAGAVNISYKEGNGAYINAQNTTFAAGTTMNLSFGNDIIKNRRTTTDFLVVSSANAINGKSTMNITNNITGQYFMASLVENGTANQIQYGLNIDTSKMVNTATMSENKIAIGTLFQGLENNATASGLDNILTALIMSKDENALEHNYDLLSLRIYNSLEEIAKINNNIIRDTLLSNSDLYSNLNVPMSYLSTSGRVRTDGLYKFGNPWVSAIGGSKSDTTDPSFSSVGYDAKFNISTLGFVGGYDYSIYGRRDDKFKLIKVGVAGSVLQNTANEKFADGSDSYDMKNTSIGLSGYYNYLNNYNEFKLIGTYSTYGANYNRSVLTGPGTIGQAKGSVGGSSIAVYGEAGLPFSWITPYLFGDVRRTNFGSYTESTSTGGELNVGANAYMDATFGPGVSVYNSIKGEGFLFDKVNLTLGAKYGFNAMAKQNTYETSFVNDPNKTNLLLNGNLRGKTVMTGYASADFLKDNLSYKFQYQLDSDSVGISSTLLFKVVIMN